MWAEYIIYIYIYVIIIIKNRMHKRRWELEQDEGEDEMKTWESKVWSAGISREERNNSGRKRLKEAETMKRRLKKNKLSKTLKSPRCVIISG